MWLPEANFTELRQGDVCSVEFFPLWDLRGAQRSMDANDVITNLTLPRMPQVIEDANRRPLVSVCTQCCDLVDRPKGGRSGIAIAPLRRVPAGPHESEKREQILASRQPDRERGWAWIHLFPLLLPPNEERDEAELVVIDWSVMISIGPHQQAVERMLRSKLHQLSDDARDDFRRKLGACFGRPATDDN